MLRFFVIATCIAAYVLSSCNPPVRLRPRNVQTGLDSTLYIGIVEHPLSVDLRTARFLAKIKVGDLGVSLDCRYPDVLNHAADRARSIGGNLLVITEHKQNNVKSNCHVIRGDIYAAPQLEGMENRMWWHPARTLLPGDLRGALNQLPQAPLPPLHTEITCRLGGDFVKMAIIRTETIFYCDSTYLPPAPSQTTLALRRAQLHFDLAELHARRLKAALADLGPNLSALTRQVRDLTARQQELLRTEQAAMDAELSTETSDAILTRWDTQIKTELSALSPYAGEVLVGLRKRG